MGYLFILALLSIFYIFALLVILAGLNKLRLSISGDEPFVSIIVAARNEEKNISALLTALTRQNYPGQKYEIIIVDDQSQDQTAQIVNSFADPRIHLVETTNRDKVISPKKNAINLGIQKAKGEILLLTDADCVPPPTWIDGVVRLFTPDVGMVIGFSPCELPRLDFPLGHLLAIESLSLAAVAAGTAGWGHAATCNGRNLAYRKKVYDQVGGFDHIQHFISGDDDLMLKLVQATDWKVQYAYDPRLTVPTRLADSAGQFANQRLRHASKGFHYNLSKVIGLLLVYLYNLMVFLTIPLALFQHISWWAPIFFFSLKALFEFTLLYQFAATMQRRYLLWIFPIAELLHIPYVVIFGALGPFKKFKWKEAQD
jgi:cellulose synthase/poly-beta-1,6-N-acetylglucosamine synthase-like glycosyltransferase